MYRAGLIGCGYIAAKHVKTISKCNDLALIALSDIDQEKMNDTVNLYHKELGKYAPISLYDNYEDIINHPHIDFVIITVLSQLHAEIAKKALRKGKHVIVEKPMALSMKDANEIIRLAEKHGKKVLVCHQLRYRPLMQKVKELLANGHLGEPYLAVASLRLNRSERYYHSSTWKGTWEKDGGMLLNQGIHLVDLLVWLIGDVKSVYGEVANKVGNKETEDVATGIIEFANTAKGLIEANIVTKPANIGYFLSIFGEKGSICIGGKHINEVYHCYVEGLPDLQDELNDLNNLNNDADEHFLMYRDFLHALKQDKQNLVSAIEGKKALETIFSLYQSDKRKKRVLLPLANFATTDMIANKNFLGGKKMIDHTAKMGEHVRIGHGAVIEENVIIGNNVKIGHHSVIKAGTIIGNDVTIKEHSIVGQIPVMNRTMARKPSHQLPVLHIEENVNIGSSCVLYRGSLIKKGALIGDLASIREHVEVGVDSIVGRNVMVENNTQIGDRVTIQTGSYVTAYMIIEDNVFIGPCVSTANDKYMGKKNDELKGPILKQGSKIGNNASLLPGVVIGKKAIIGAGAVVTKNVNANETVVGNPAKKIN